MQKKTEKKRNSRDHRIIYLISGRWAEEAAAAEEEEEAAVGGWVGGWAYLPSCWRVNVKYKTEIIPIRAAAGGGGGGGPGGVGGGGGHE